MMLQVARYATSRTLPYPVSSNYTIRRTPFFPAYLKIQRSRPGTDHHHCRRVVGTIPTSGRLYSALYFSRRHVAQPIALYRRNEARRACRSCAAQFRSGLRGYFAPLATPVRTKRHGTRRPGIRRGIPAVMAVLFLLLRSGFRYRAHGRYADRARPRFWRLTQKFPIGVGSACGSSAQVPVLVRRLLLC